MYLRDVHASSQLSIPPTVRTFAGHAGAQWLLSRSALASSRRPKQRPLLHRLRFKGLVQGGEGLWRRCGKGTENQQIIENSAVATVLLRQKDETC